MTVKEFRFQSCEGGSLHVCCWIPDCEPIGIVQIAHGICEHIGRYDAFARYLSASGYIVAGHDHMGHGRSVPPGEPKAYFRGGWFSAVEDTIRLANILKEKYPAQKHILFGHSMGSFIVRTILADYPDLEISACVLCGTCWMPETVLRAGKRLCDIVCKYKGEKNPSKRLQRMVFGSYNLRIEHPRTPYDWVCRSGKVVDAYLSDPLCALDVTAGLMRDMLTGLIYVQQQDNLQRMNKKLPILFVAGGDDPVGLYGEGIEQCFEAFSENKIVNMKKQVYPLCRHEILHEINKAEIMEDILLWINSMMYL